MMTPHLRSEAETILHRSIAAVQPEAAVRRALSGFAPVGRVYLVAVGKAAWAMAHAALGCLGHVDGGVVITKYGHVQGELPGVICYEAGHPIPDENGFAATARALDLVRQAGAQDTVVFLLSGGGSALFEQPLIPSAELQDITGQLLASGANIVEMNTIRKRLSGVKGGRFALACAPASVFAIVLSDIVGDPLDMIASGPACPDSSTCAGALAVAGACRDLGYKPVLLTDHLDCEAREAGRFLADIARTHAGQGKRLAFIAGGETVVHLTGHGLGGRNQELALAAAPGLAGLDNVAVFSVGSDGTDGPTDAAGGYVDGDTQASLTAKGWQVPQALADNDAYHALQAVGGLLITGPTGTNVNDVAVALIQG